jgi:hypothetical protein
VRKSQKGEQLRLANIEVNLKGVQGRTDDKASFHLYKVPVLKYYVVSVYLMPCTLEQYHCLLYLVIIIVFCS